MDLHTHSTLSDGLKNPQEIAKLIKKKKLSGLAFTEHNYVSKKMKRVVMRENLILIWGVELAAREGHLLAYGSEFESISKICHKFEPIDFYLELARDLNLLVAACHPFDYLRHGIGKIISNYRWDAIETFNASTATPFSNFKAERIARKLKLPEIGGSDAHALYYGYGFTEVEVESEKPIDILDAIKKGRCKTGGSHVLPHQMARRIYLKKIKHKV
ncbi:MAG: PHP-associated domain-containing protein [Candidatus Methanofastidiosia archaeon]